METINKDKYSLFPLNGVSVPVTIFEESKLCILQIYFFVSSKLFASAGIESASPLEMIYKANTTSELAGLGRPKRYFNIEIIYEFVIYHL